MKKAPRKRSAGRAATARDRVPLVNANQVRWFGEHADGFRGERLFVVHEPGTEPPVKVVSERQIPKLKPHDVLLEVETAFRGKGGMRARPEDLKIALVYKDKLIVLEDADAAFISQSAVEKFLFPYYLRFKSPTQVETMMANLYNDKSVIAVEHIPPSIEVAVRARGVRDGAKKLDLL